MKHRNIIELYHYTENKEEVALYLEYANKPSYLHDLIIEQHTPIEDEAQLKIFARQILEGLAYIHNQGVIHGDIKLENMLTHETEEDGLVMKICDFGVSHILDPSKGGKLWIENAFGTFGY